MLGLVPFVMGENNRMGESFDDLFKEFNNDLSLSSFDIGTKFKADIKETDNKYVVEAELPGVKKEDINIDYDNNNLTISAFRNEVFEDKNDNYVRRERHYGEVSRSFYVDNVDKDNISATFDNGVLNIDLPKKERRSNNSSRIEIR